MAKNVLNQFALGKRALSSDEDDRVLELFRSRAELKKAYSELQEEIHHLKERLKQQEGVTAHVQEMLSSLETKLGDRAQAYSTIVLYQLRRLWRSGHDVLVALCADLEAQQLERERLAYVVELNRQHFARRQQCEAQLAKSQAAAVAAREAVQAAEQQIGQLSRPWHRSARKEQEARLPPLQAAVAAADAALESARAALDAVQKESDRAFPGLSVQARRGINISVIACAENLNAGLEKSTVLALARSAATRPESVDAYGNREECEAIVSDVALAHAVLEQRGQLSAEIQARCDSLHKTAAYAHDQATIPVPDSLFSAPKPEILDVLDGLQPKPPAAPQRANVLIEDSWEILRVLIQ